MTLSDSRRPPTLPTRKEIRLARLAAEEEARRIEDAKRKARADRLADMLERSEGCEPVRTRKSLRQANHRDYDSAAIAPVGNEGAVIQQSEARIDICATRVDADIDETEHKTEPIRAISREVIARPRMTPSGSVRSLRVSKPAVRIVASMAAVVAGAGVAVGLFGLPGGAPAQASVTLSDSILNTLNIGTKNQTPQSLTARSGAADQWRLSEAERTFTSSEPGEKCDVMSGASSLASAFYDQSDSVVLPLALGDYKLTSNYGYRYDPFTGRASRHLGQDFSAPVGTPIYAVADGRVLHAGLGLDGRSNNLIILQHDIDGQKFTSWYVHMYDDGTLVKAGDEVKVGDTIGLVGNNGRSTGPHLHFEVHQGEGIDDTDTTNPLTFLHSLGARDVAELCF